MTRADKFIQIVFGAEGFYSNDKTDSGGETLYGIARNKNPYWRGWTLVDQYKKKANFPNNMKADKTLIELKNEFYKTNYYTPVKADLINDELLALHVFDFGVTSGTGTAIKTLQQVAGVDDDGKIGNITLQQVNRGDYTEKYIQARKDYYNRIAEVSLQRYELQIGRKVTETEKMTKTNYKYLKGWINRVNNLTKLIS